MNLLKSISSPLVHFLYPHICLGCGSDTIEDGNFICLECISELPHTNFALQANNAVEKLFWGRLPVEAAMSELYFSTPSVVQNLVHEFKYRGNKNIGLYFGKLMGKSLLNSNRFNNVDAIIPLPLFYKKEMKRGFNQSAVLCEGIGQVLNIPVVTKAVNRAAYTDSQTRKDRTDRWLNVEKSFAVIDKEIIKGKHVLLVDDVITTAATLEACGSQILKTEGTLLSIATLCISKN